MRGGLWQKQKRPSACLLCLYSYSSYSSRRGLRILSNPATRPTIARGSPLLGSTAARQFGGKGFLPQWGVKPATEPSPDDELLPHELAAREAARAAKAAKDAAAAKAKAEREEAARIAEAHRLAKAEEAQKAAEERRGAKAAAPAAGPTRQNGPRSGPLPRQDFVRAPAQRQAFTGNSPLKRSNAPLPPSEPLIRRTPVGSPLPPSEPFIRRTPVGSPLPPSEPFIRRAPVASPLLTPAQPSRPIQPAPSFKPTTGPTPAPKPAPAPSPAPTPRLEPLKAELGDIQSPSVKASSTPQVAKSFSAKPLKGVSAIPAWGSFGKPIVPTAATEPDDGLLPHERAARDQALKERQEAEERERLLKEKAEQEKLDKENAERAAREQAARETAEKERLALENERLALEKARLALERERLALETAQRERADNERVALENAQRAAKDLAARELAIKERLHAKQEKARAAAASADPWAHLLPHEREAKEKAKRERERAEREQEEKAERASADPLAHLLPHERAAREQQIKERQAAEARSASSQPAQTYQRNSNWASRETGEAPIRDTPSSKNGFRNQVRTDKPQWQQLQRRDSPLHSNGISRALPTNPFRPTPNADPFKPSFNASAGHPEKPPGKSDLDPWARLAQAVEEPFEHKSTSTGSKAADENWDWVGDDYVAKSQHTKAVAAAEAAEAEPKPYIVSSDADVTSYNERRNERRGRFDAPEKEKPKKTQSKQRGRGRDDDFDEYEYEERRQRKADRKAEKEKERLALADQPTPILLPEFISVANLAVALGQKVKPFVRQLEELGFEEVGKDNIVTGETAALIAQEYGFDPTIESGEDRDLKPRPPPEDPSSLPLRPPVVTIMGHVDHGKTTLLDYLRKSSIVSQEHGGITQHIGAFSVKMSTGKTITFLDTPGHAAFLSMRQRGANVTDIVILVVAADDSVKPQTIEAIKHAQGARVPIIVAINKIDKDSANIDRVKSDLAAQGLEIEDYGGDVQVVPVSGKTGQGMDDLEENILLLSEMLEIRSETDGMAEGWVLESSIKPIGRVATVLIKRGTLRRGDFIVAGRVFTKVRSLRNEAGQEVSEAPPGTAVEVLGWKDPPEAGDMIIQAPDEGRAKDAVDYRQELKERELVIAQMAEQEQAAREKELEREREEKRQKALEEGEEFVEDEDPTSSIKYVNFTVKGDVHGSVEAVTASILEQGNNEVRPRVLLSSSGQITESDVDHATVSGSSIINFNNPIPGHIKRKADDAGVKILDHNIIYHLVEEVRNLLSEQLAPVITYSVVAEAEVLQIFPINIKGRTYKNIAGCRIRNGTVQKNSKCRVIRGDKIVFEGAIDELKQGKKEITEIRKGNECGISFENWEDFQEGDHIQTVEEVVEKRTL
ncbi:hypothetical protein QBC43DRAFT_325951 [Cladorrhinum sp. PSN259]|nr:hypothetical protein QBC43DRAFT_325951 [Cladorrhinum sp. PSN259]